MSSCSQPPTWSSNSASCWRSSRLAVRGGGIRGWRHHDLVAGRGGQRLAPGAARESGDVGDPPSDADRAGEPPTTNSDARASAPQQWTRANGRMPLATPSGSRHAPARDGLRLRRGGGSFRVRSHLGWTALFISGHGVWTSLENAAIGPLSPPSALSVPSGTCAGGGPVARRDQLRGVVSFLFGDLITIPLLLIYRKQYGGRTALRMLGSSGW